MLVYTWRTSEYTKKLVIYGGKAKEKAYGREEESTENKSCECLIKLKD